MACPLRPAHDRAPPFRRFERRPLFVQHEFGLRTRFGRDPPVSERKHEAFTLAGADDGPAFDPFPILK